MYFWLKYFTDTLIFVHLGILIFDDLVIVGIQTPHNAYQGQYFACYSHLSGSNPNVFIGKARYKCIAFSGSLTKSTARLTISIITLDII